MLQSYTLCTALNINVSSQHIQQNIFFEKKLQKSFDFSWHRFTAFLFPLTFSVYFLKIFSPMFHFIIWKFQSDLALIFLSTLKVISVFRIFMLMHISVYKRLLYFQGPQYHIWAIVSFIINCICFHGSLNLIWSTNS